jgi:putative transposase
MPWETRDAMNQRTEFALRARETDNFRGLCREYGISPKVGYKWKERLEKYGLAGMEEQSRRPHSSPEQLSEEVVCRMVQIKERHRPWGPRKIREVYLRQWSDAPSESTFKRVLERCGLTEKRRVRRAVETGRISSGRKAAAANEIWTVDFKGWWHDAQGRCDPLTVRDEHSRYVLELRAVPDAKTETVKACFERLFELHGMPGAIRSDNGSPFASVNGVLGLSRLSAWWLANGIDLERSRPGCPQDNGGHERMHRDIAGELQGAAYGERQAALETWRREFNEERPHEALGMQVPAEVYRPVKKPWKGGVEEISYPGKCARKVNCLGVIRYEGKVYPLSKAIAGWHVGLSPREDGKQDVYFSRMLIGQMEPQTASFVRARGNPESPVKCEPKNEK